MMLWVIITWMGLEDLRSVSSIGDNSGLPANCLMNPCGICGNTLLAMVHSSKMPVPSSSILSGLSGVGMVATPSSWASGSSGHLVFFAGFRAVMGFSSSRTNMEILRRSSILMRYVRHLQWSWMAPQSLPRGVSDCTAHCWRHQASATISLCLTTLMSQKPLGSVNNGGRKSHLFSPAR